MAGSVAQSNSGSVNSATSVPCSYSGVRAVGAIGVLHIAASNVFAGAPTGWTQRLSAVNNQDFKVYTRTLDNTATDNPTLSVGSCSSLWQIFELAGVSGIDVVGTAAGSASVANSSPSIAATPTAGNRYMMAFVNFSTSSFTSWLSSAASTWTNSFADVKTSQVNGGAGAPNDALKSSVGALSASVAATSQSTVCTLDNASDNGAPGYGMIIFTESAAGTKSPYPFRSTSPRRFQLPAGFSKGIRR